MKIDLKGIVIICGNYGSGKTETAVNLALDQKRQGIDVRVADLDLVNPYFRTRAAIQVLENAGIELVLPDKKYMHADLPILAPAVAGMIQQPAELTIIDAGGDDVGVTVLAALSDHLTARNVNMLQVINPFRPFTENVQGCIKVQKEIEKSSKLKITGLVGNANLMDETTADHICQGHDFLADVSTAANLETAFITAGAHLVSQLDIRRFTCPVLEINRRLNFPWK